MSFRSHPAEIQRPIRDGRYHAWCEHTALSAEFFRFPSGFLIRFLGLADFAVDDSGEIVCTPTPESGEAWRGLYEQQVQPLLLSLRGEQVFHGAAIAVGDLAIAVLGPSGRGKSTLTAAFARRGHAFLGDDCLHLDLSGPQVQVHPQADYVRLWEDSAGVLGEGDVAYVAGSPKPRLIASEDLPHCARPLPLARVYLLGEGTATAPAITPVAPAEQLMGWTTNAFVLDIRNPDVLRRNLSAAARLVREIPMQRLDYPRRYELLDTVVDTILADVASSNGR